VWILPLALIKEVLKCKDNAQVREAGIQLEYLQQSKELAAAGVPSLLFYG
jgi:methylenetetrahydrofolate reductase (NADPH)